VVTIVSTEPESGSRVCSDKSSTIDASIIITIVIPHRIINNISIDQLIDLSTNHAMDPSIGEWESVVSCGFFCLRRECVTGRANRTVTFGWGGMVAVVVVGFRLGRVERGEVPLPVYWCYDVVVCIFLVTTKTPRLPVS